MYNCDIKYCLFIDLFMRGKLTARNIRILKQINHLNYKFLLLEIEITIVIAIIF